jgi:hypothetical protein
MKQFWLPYKPFTPADLWNQMAAAHGHVSTIEDTHRSNYNGHRITLEWNDYRGYYIAEYFWAGRRVLTRTCNFALALKACIEYHDSVNGAGGSLIIRPNTLEDEGICENHPRLQSHTTKIENNTYKSMCTPEHEEIRMKFFRTKRDMGYV